MPTPFDAADAIDLEAFAALCERQVAAGVPAIVVCERTGETPTLSPTDQEPDIGTAVDVARGRVRIIAALKYSLGFLGLMSPATRLPIVPLDAPQRDVVRAFAAIDNEELIDSIGA